MIYLLTFFIYTATIMEIYAMIKFIKEMWNTTYLKLQIWYYIKDITMLIALSAILTFIIILYKK